MPERGGYIASGLLHVLIVLLFLVGLPTLFRKQLPDDMPLVVQLVKLGPETRATEVAKTVPRPEVKPEPPQPPPPKPEPPKSEPPKPQPPPVPETPPAPPPPPPPAPEPKPEPPKAETPPQPMPKPPPPKPTPPKPKQDEAAFDTLLKNLAKNDPDKTPPDQKAKPDQAQPKNSPQPIAPLGDQLTVSEMDLVKQQIEACWNVPAGAREAQDMTPEFRVAMNPDGTVRDVVQTNIERNSDQFFQAAADSARRALLNPRCQPLKLPPDKYDQWQNFTITFDPKDVSG
jgi:hypothetical protein